MAVRKRKTIGKKAKGPKGAGLSKTAKARKGKHERINQCHDFAWSRSLWKNAANQIGKVCFVLVIAYLICATSLAASDGLGAVDMFFFISTTTTTIGLGDIAPSDQVNRAAAIILLPFGLVIISFGISVIIALAYAKPFKPTTDEEPKEILYDENQGYFKYYIEEIQHQYEMFVGTFFYRLLVMFFKYVAVLFIGVVFISLNDRERRLQKAVGEDMTIIDATYFATVLATTVGYGHRIVPQTDSLKLFLTFYMYLSTFVAGSIIGDISTLFLESKEDAIIDIMVSSTTWVHKADLFQIGKICESDYVLFKLQQLQMVDDVVRRRLTNRFTELDFERRNRLLMIGRDVPSAEQVAKMKEAIKDQPGKTLIRAWSEMRAELVAYHFEHLSETGDQRPSMIGCGGRYDSMRYIEEENEEEEEGGGGGGVVQNDSFADKVRKRLSLTKKGKSNDQTNDQPTNDSDVDIEANISLKTNKDDTNGGAPGQEVKDDTCDNEEEDEKQDRFNDKVQLLTPEQQKQQHQPPHSGESFLHSATRSIFGNKAHSTDGTFDDVDNLISQQSMSYEDMLKVREARPLRLSDCHDFAWSRQLWREAAYDTFKLASVLVIIYTILGWYLLVKPEKMSVIVGCYFLSATLSTVGFGDFAPTRQDTRFSAIFLIPFGLIIIGFLLSFVTAYTKSLPFKEDDGEVDPTVLERRALFETLDKNGDGILTKKEVIDGCHLMSLTPEEAEQLFDSMDYEKKGKLYPLPVKPIPFKKTVMGKLFILFIKMFLTILVGALFFKLYQPEADQLHLTWIDAFYFATVTSTSVGYGDITPQTNGGRIFMIFYMLISTIIVGGVLSEVIDIYVNDFEGEKIIKTIIDSTTWVHSADVGHIGVITEADYVLFKLQQMQKVDAEMLDLLIDRFEELDENANGWLDVGIDVPSAKQVAKMQAELKDNASGKNIIALWKEKQSKMETVLKARMEGDLIRHSRADLDEDDPTIFIEKLNVVKEYHELKKSRESMLSPLRQRPLIGGGGGGGGQIDNNNNKKNEERSSIKGFMNSLKDFTSNRDFVTRLGTSLDDVTVSTDPSVTSRSLSIETELNQQTTYVQKQDSNNDNENSNSFTSSITSSTTTVYQSMDKNIDKNSFQSSDMSSQSQTSSFPSSVPASSNTVNLYAARYDHPTSSLTTKELEANSFTSTQQQNQEDQQKQQQFLNQKVPSDESLSNLSSINIESVNQQKNQSDMKPSPKRKIPKPKSTTTTPSVRSRSNSAPIKKKLTENVEMV